MRTRSDSRSGVPLQDTRPQLSACNEGHSLSETRMSTTAARLQPAPPLNLYLLRSSLVAALGGLLFGFDTAVIAGTTRALTDTYGLTPAMLGITVSSALWGTVIGSLCAGPPSDHYGRPACFGGLGALYAGS